MSILKCVAKRCVLKMHIRQMSNKLFVSYSKHISEIKSRSAPKNNDANNMFICLNSNKTGIEPCPCHSDNP